MTLALKPPGWFNDGTSNATCKYLVYLHEGMCLRPRACDKMLAKIIAHSFQKSQQIHCILMYKIQSESDVQRFITNSILHGNFF